MSRANSIRIGAIENSGPNTLVSYLRNAGNDASQIDIAVAFVTTAGLDSVFHLLKKASVRGQVRVLTGLYQGFTEPKALRTLLKEQRQSSGRLVVQLSADPHFHWKTYFLMGKTKAHVVIGSSNLTVDGLQQTGEFNAVLSIRKTSKTFSDLHGPFERHWQAKSRPLTEEVLGKYEDWRESVEIATLNRTVPLGKILALSRRKPKAEIERKPSFWRTCINGPLSPESDALLKVTTDWDRRGYNYFSTWRTSYCVGDRVVLFDLDEKNVTIVEILETTRTPERTPDGFHFAAYLRVRRTRLRRLVPKRWKSFKAAGLLRRKDDVNLTRKLSATRFEAFVENLNEAAK